MKKKPFGSVLYAAFVLILSAGLWSGCGRERGEDKAAAFPEKIKKVPEAIEPFLKPDVGNVAGVGNLKGDKAVVADLIINYNKAIISSQIYMENLGSLVDLTSKKEFTRMNASIEKDRMEGKIMSCNLRNLEFLKISLKGEEGMVRTVEDWFFEDRDLKTGKVIESFRDAQYEVEYGVVKEQERWVVDKVGLIRAKEFAPPRGKPERTAVMPSFDKEDIEQGGGK